MTRLEARYSVLCVTVSLVLYILTASLMPAIAPIFIGMVIGWALVGLWILVGLYWRRRPR